MTLDLSPTSAETIDKMILQHYGSVQYDKESFTMVTNSDLWCKPNGGLWCSIQGSADCWAMWCRGNDFNIKDLETGFKLKFHPGAAVCQVDSYADLLRLPVRPARIDFLPFVFYDFELMASCGIDAIYLTERGQLATRYTEPRSLYGWDCESVLVLNKDSVLQI